MNASCYFWKWADNDLPGKPLEVHAALLRGELHPAVQTLDARPVLAAIEAMAHEIPQTERDEWEWLVGPTNQEQSASFILLNRPRSEDWKAMHHAMARGLLRFGVTCFDESLGILGDWFPPKLNEFQCGQWSGEMLYDITPNELPALIRRIRPKSRNPFAVLTNRHTHFVQCYREAKGYYVEWRENYALDGWNKFDHWRAQDRKHLATLNAPHIPTDIPSGKDPDLLTFADTLNIFRAFLLQQSRPSRYHWRHINTELP